MSAIRYVRGDATCPEGSGPRIIAHVCNDIGGWGRGFVLALSRHWTQPETCFRRWYHGRTENDFGLGAVQLVPVDHDLFVANMVAQHGIRSRTHAAAPPIRYGALERCPATLASHAVELDASVHMPRIGAGLAGGRWDEIEPLIQRQLTDHGIGVTVYNLGRARGRVASAG